MSVACTITEGSQIIFKAERIHHGAFRPVQGELETLAFDSSLVTIPHLEHKTQKRKWRICTLVKKHSER